MKAVIGGVRGTTSIAQADFMKYGGETTSVLLQGDDGTTIVLDAGTGIRELGMLIEAGPAPEKILLLFSHFHMDHMVGLPSLSLLYKPGYKIVMAATHRCGRYVEEVLPQLLAQPYWPVQLDQMRASIEFMNLPKEESFEPMVFGALEVRWCPVHHPGGCTAFRVDEPRTGRSFLFATDIEWVLSETAEKNAFMRLCTQPSPASAMLFDGHFSRANYAEFRGWGHSCWEDAIEVAREAGIAKVLVSHHSPSNNDARLQGVEKEITASMSQAVLARDGMELIL